MTAPTLKGTTIERAPHSENTRDDALMVIVRPGCERFAAWAKVGQEHFHAQQGYQTVNPKDVELLEGGSWTPTKDFGLRIRFDKSAQDVRIGENILMWCYTRERDERLERERVRALRIKPRQQDRDESAEETDEIRTLKSELDTN